VNRAEILSFADIGAKSALGFADYFDGVVWVDFNDSAAQIVKSRQINAELQ
jgi:hypothetical protein